MQWWYRGGIGGIMGGKGQIFLLKERAMPLAQCGCVDIEFRRLPAH